MFQTLINMQALEHSCIDYIIFVFIVHVGVLGFLIIWVYIYTDHCVLNKYDTLTFLYEGKFKRENLLQ